MVELKQVELDFVILIEMQSILFEREFQELLNYRVSYFYHDSIRFGAIVKLDNFRVKSKVLGNPLSI